MRLNVYRQTVILISILFFFANPSLSKGLKGPDEFYKKNIPILKDNKKNENIITKTVKKPVLSILNAGLTVYQYGVSGLTGANCSMYPSCSHYSREVLQKHGSFIGLMMTTDRLIHEAEELEIGTLIKKDGRYYIADPVSANDFWWANEKK